VRLVTAPQLGAFGLLIFSVGALHEFIGWFPGRIPLDHLPAANVTIDAAAVSNGQLGITDQILRPAVTTIKATTGGEC